jgi:hypothetical protein
MCSRFLSAASSCSSRFVTTSDAGAPKLNAPLAHPVNHIEVSFLADPTQEYKLWIRLKAERNFWGNDSVWVQFSGGQTGVRDRHNRRACGEPGGMPALRPVGVGLGRRGWGAVNQNGTTLRFPAGGPQRLRIQTREDGVAIDQIVLSSRNYKTTRPGTAKNNTVILQPAGPVRGLVVGSVDRNRAETRRGRGKAFCGAGRRKPAHDDSPPGGFACNLDQP